MSLTVTIPGAVLAEVGATAPATLVLELGVPGPIGATGAAGPGVAAGGTAGQVLAKIDGTNYNTEWVNVEGDYLPLAGGTMTGPITFDGTSGQYISKGNFDTSRGGNYGISLVCSIGYEFNWQAGWLTTTEQSSVTPRPLYLDSLAGTTLRAWNSSTSLGTEVSHTGITFPDATVQTTAYTDGGPYLPLAGGAMNTGAEVTISDGSGHDSELAGWGLGIELSSDHAQGTTVEYNGLNVYDSAGTMEVTPAGITFPDSTVQTTAFLGYASPAFTGIPTAPSATLGDDSTQIATTAFVQDAIIAGSAHAETLVANVRNNTGSSLPAFTVVYITGAVGNKAAVAKAQANSEATSSGTFAITETAIANNADGNVVSAGVLSGVNTSAFTDGDKLYLSPTVAGAVTTTKPSAPNHLVYIGVVTRSHPNLGTVSVRIQNGYELEELHNVAIASVADKDSLFYESSTSLWKNYTPANARTNLGLGTMATQSSATYATIASPTFTGTPLSTTASVSTNTTQIATTAFVLGQAGTGTPIVDGTAAVGTSLLYARQDHVHGTDTTRAPLASPSLTGTPLSTTASIDTNSTQIATTAFVRDMLSDCTWSVPPISTTTTATSGTGAAYVNVPPDYGYLTGPNVNLAGYCQKGIALFARSNSTYGFNYTKEMRIACKMAIYWTNAFTGITYTLIQRLGTSGTGALGVVGFGISINMATKVLSIVAHNGTTLTTKATSWVAPTSGVASIDFMVKSDGTGTVSAYADGVFIDSTTGMSTATSSANTSMFVAVEINSAGTSSTANALGYVSNLRTFVAHG